MGILEFSDGTKYEGKFKDDKYNGKGKIYKKNIINGKGKLFLEENKYYEGNSVNDQLHGNRLNNIHGKILTRLFRFGKIIIAQNDK